MLLTARAQIYCISEKERKKEKRFFERCAVRPLMQKRYGNAGLQNLWAVNSPIISLGGFFSFLPVVMSIASFTETDGLLQQARNDLVIWSETYQGENSASQTTLDGMKFGLCQCKYMTQK